MRVFTSAGKRSSNGGGPEAAVQETDQLEALRSAKSRGEEQRLAEESERIADAADAAATDLTSGLTSGLAGGGPFDGLSSRISSGCLSGACAAGATWTPPARAEVATHSQPRSTSASFGAVTDAFSGTACDAFSGTAPGAWGAAEGGGFDGGSDPMSAFAASMRPWQPEAAGGANVELEPLEPDFAAQ